MRALEYWSEHYSTVSHFCCSKLVDAATVEVVVDFVAAVVVWS